jgi:hypothetical protein
MKHQFPDTGSAKEDICALCKCHVRSFAALSPCPQKYIPVFSPAKPVDLTVPLAVNAPREDPNYNPYPKPWPFVFGT